ncbi:MAG: DUF1540 domain-containing protein [Clostridia bacterium]|nr:DUF1540 domain-containing protein [Clostridia bacterium]
MENVNHGVACEVSNCKYNFGGHDCTLAKIRVGFGCVGEDCTCCESFCEE